MISSDFRHVTYNWELKVKIFTLKWEKDNERATSSFMDISEAIKKGSEKLTLYACLRYIGIGKEREKGHVTY